MRCLLAIDSGGTKCDAVLVAEDGLVLGWGHSRHAPDATHRHPGGYGRSEKAVVQAIREAMRDAPEGELHVSGRPPIPHGVLAERSGEPIYHGVREQDAPMALVQADSGVVVLAGTGAFVFGRSAQGKELLLDALGPLYGDHGGAFQIGLAAIRACGQANWHSRRATILSEAIPAACSRMAGAPPGFNMVSFMLEQRDRSEIASLARIVDTCAREGDEIALSILTAAADDAAETVRDVVDRLELATESLPLIGTGSVAVRSRLYWDRVCETVRSFAPNLRPILADRPPALGAILVMAAQLGLASAAFRELLFASAVQQRNDANVSIP